MTYRVTERCWLMSGPHDYATHLAWLPVGTVLVGDVWDDRWIQVRQVGGRRRVGYVLGEYVERTSP